MSLTSVWVANRFGNPLTEIKAEINYCTWRISKTGKCEFSISSGDSKATDGNLRFGNKVLMQFENGLPAWGGVIDVPRSWNDGKIFLTAYTGDRIFQYRTTDKYRAFTGYTVGNIYSTLITEANDIDNTGVIVGNINDDGIAHGPVYHYKNLLAIFQDSLTKRLSTGEFDVTGHLVNGKVILRANFYTQKGKDLTQLELVEGNNLESIILREQGPIINSWDVAGQGTDWGDERLTSNDQNQTSIGSYGLREDSKTYSDVVLQKTLNSHSVNLLDKSKYPYNIFDITTLDEEPAKFADYGVGDTISLLSHSVGFGGVDTTVRILAREYNPMEGTCNLVVQEVL